MTDQYVKDTKYRLSEFLSEMDNMRVVCSKDFIDKWEGLENEIDMLLGQYESNKVDLESAKEIIDEAGLTDG